MTTWFETTQDIFDFLVETKGIIPKTIKECEVPPVYNLSDLLRLSRPNITDDERQRITSQYPPQQGYTAKNNDGESVEFVIRPYMQGFDCMIMRGNKFATRL